MLQIRLSKPSSETGATVKQLSTENVTVACPDHLVLADLPVAKGIGVATAATTVKSVGRRSRRLLGERVHFCVRCDLPIAIYGRLSPCEHAFCLDCARSDSICYLCDERIQKIQTIKMMEGIFICAAPHCLKSFLKRADFEFHIHGTHADLLQPKDEKDGGNESDSATRAALPQQPPLPSSSNSQFLLDFEEDKSQLLQNQNQNPPLLHLPMLHAHINGVHYSAMPQQTAISKNPPMNPVPMPNMVLQMNTNPALVPPFVPGFQSDGARIGGGNGHGSLLGLSAMADTYHENWNTAPALARCSMGVLDGLPHAPIPFYPGEYGGLPLRFPHPPPPPLSSSMDAIHGSTATDSRDSKGILTAAHQPFPLPPPPPAPFSLPLLRRDLHSADP